MATPCVQIATLIAAGGAATFAALFHERKTPVIPSTPAPAVRDDAKERRSRLI